MKTLRLLITEKCNRSCDGCCNKQWDLNKLPVCTDYRGYDEIIITGGEPLLFWEDVYMLMSRICGQLDGSEWLHAYKTKFILYTAMPFFQHQVLNCFQGITLTLHEQNDVENYYKFHDKLAAWSNGYLFHKLSLRLNVFKGIDFLAKPKWIVKDNIEWIKNCPLPENESFMRIKNLITEKQYDFLKNN